MNYLEAQEDLKVIKKMMESCRAKQQDSAIFNILWGTVIPLTTITTQYLVQLQLYNAIAYVWPIVCFGSFIVTIFIGIHHSKKVPQSLYNKVESALWGAIGITIGFTTFLFFINNLPINIAMMIIGLLLGIGYFVSSFLTELIMTKIIAIMWWIIGIIVVFLEGYFSAYIIGIAPLFLMFLPNLILVINKKRQSASCEYEK